jgi:hypothetical protein
MLSVIMQSIVILNVVMQSVVAPLCGFNGEKSFMTLSQCGIVNKHFSLRGLQNKLKCLFLVIIFSLVKYEKERLSVQTCPELIKKVIDKKVLITLSLCDFIKLFFAVLTPHQVSSVKYLWSLQVLLAYYNICEPWGLYHRTFYSCN